LEALELVETKQLLFISYPALYHTDCEWVYEECQ